MDEEKVTQTAMEPAQQPKPKARGGQRTQGKTASGTGARQDGQTPCQQ